ncbi:MAG: class I SAM-dependent methyltransferase [Archaeoglobaceae archaeon]|nr:class I SAM-dependent methyltransferase [Archaeoglobaceae archaeon]
MKILDLGSGRRPYQEENAEVIHLDIVKLPHIEIVHDLNKFPWPFKDNEFDKVRAVHILEHIWDTVKAMEEIYRILKPKGILYIEVPIFPNPCCYRDPTHKKVFEKDTFDFFCPDTPLGKENEYCTNARFKIKDKSTDTWGPNLYLTLEAIK